MRGYINTRWAITNGTPFAAMNAAPRWVPSNPAIAIPWLTLIAVSMSSRFICWILCIEGGKYFYSPPVDFRTTSRLLPDTGLHVLVVRVGTRGADAEVGLELGQRILAGSAGGDGGLDDRDDLGLLGFDDRLGFLGGLFGLGSGRLLFLRSLRGLGGLFSLGVGNRGGGGNFGGDVGVFGGVGHDASPKES